MDKFGMTTTLLSGVAFGAALTASGVHHPSAILGQLKLADWDMLETFLTATASSTSVRPSHTCFCHPVKGEPERLAS